MLKRIQIPGFGPYVFGRLRPAASAPPRRIVYPFADAKTPAPPANFGMSRAFSSVRIAAAARPIYAAEEDILANNRYGDCTCAGALHLMAIFSAILKRGVNFRRPNVANALWLYAQVTDPKFDAVTGANDNGADEQTVLEFLRTHGAYEDGTGRIASWATVDATRPDVMRQVLFSNNNLYLGVELPDAWLNPAPGRAGFLWDVAGDPNPENGHCIVAYGYNETGILIDTWGLFRAMTWAAVAKYCSAPSGELYTLVAA